MKLIKIIECLEKWAPPILQEEYDNSGLIIGNKNNEINGVLVTLDCTEEILDEAINKKCNLIISHHPIIFNNIKRLNGSNYVEKCIIKAIKNEISIYSIHTNLDNVITGVNKKLAEKIKLKNIRILNKKENVLSKIEFYTPKKYKEKILKKLFQLGAGRIGNYNSCSFQTLGKGTYIPEKKSKPLIGSLNKLESVNEVKIELIYQNNIEDELIKNLKQVHPYDQVAFFISKINNTSENIGSGIIGDLKIDFSILLKNLKSKFNLKFIKHSKKINKKINKIAVCGGSGSFLIKDAIKSGADAFITSDVKYHDFFQSENKIIIIDIGHYESEQFTKELIFEYLNKKLINIAIHLSKMNSNPITYY